MQPCRSIDWQQAPGAPDARAGMTFFVVTMMLAALFILGAAIFTSSMSDLGATRHYRDELAALLQADSGAHQVLSQIGLDLDAGTLSLSGRSIRVNYTAPAGYTFETVTQLDRLSDRISYRYVVTGRMGRARQRVDLCFTRERLLDFGVFGNQQVETKAFGRIMGYYSSDAGNPSPADSNGELDLGSNHSVITRNGSQIDGDILLGMDTSGNTATWTDQGATVDGVAGEAIPHVNPDPLGIASGALAQVFNQVRVVNNNARANPPILNNRIQLGAGENLVLPAGDYYVQSLDIANGATIHVVPANSQVRIFLDGAADFKLGSTVNVNGDPPDLSLFSRSNADIRLFNNGNFKGLIYAPFADVSMNHGADFYGVVWADDVLVRNSGDLYVDMDILNSFLSRKPEILSWKHIP